MSAPDLVNMADIPLKPVEWLWKDRIPLGKVTLFVGHPGDGKTLLSLYVAARISQGGVWPDGAPGLPKPAGTILLSAEDDPSDTLGPRLVASSGDRSRIEFMKGVLEEKNGKVESRWFSLLHDLEAIRAAVKGRPGTRLVVLDTLSAYLGGTDTFKDSDVRRALGPLAALAAELHVAIVAILHCNKSSLQKAIHRVSGSIAFVAQARASWVIGRDPDDSERHLMLPLKNNLTRRPTGLAFRLKGVALTGFPESLPAIEWEPGTVTMDPDTMLAGGGDAAQDRPSMRDEAKEWLRGQLRSGPVSAQEIERRAKADGIAKRTLDRAKRELGARSKRGPDGRSYWRLAGADDDPPGKPPVAGGSPGNPGNVGNLGDLDSREEPFSQGEHCQDRQACQGCQDAARDLEGMEERAAILEYEAGLPREQAEALARGTSSRARVATDA